MPGEKENERLSLEEEGLPAAPLSLEGSYILHQMFRVRWLAWRSLAPTERQGIVEEATGLLGAMERRNGEASALFSLLGHKGDLMLLHFRRTVDALNGAELGLAQLRLGEFLEQTTSYLSVVELGLYEASVRLYTGLKAKGLKPDSPEWNREVEAELERQRKTAQPRLWPEIPLRRYVSFYPMSKMRGQTKNWYQLPMESRQRMMREHGVIGRKYAGQVIQIISGSIGLDDWEWGVDLFSDDPLVFKKLVAEMRFDEASAVYALFGPFYVGLRFPATELGTFFEGKPPAFEIKK